MEELTLEQVVRQTGISTRNVKYWCTLHRLEVRRRGRRNLYPPSTVSLLEAIARLADLHVYTTRFTRWLVDLALGRPPAEPELHRKLNHLCALHGGILGIVLPKKPGEGDRGELPRLAGSWRIPSAPRSPVDDDTLL